MDDAHSKAVEEVSGFFRTDINTGLSDELVTEYQAKYGPNGEFSCIYTGISKIRFK
jgi:hypothetical protein